MILHEYKTIFSHIPKTGGQSIELFFLNKLGMEWKDRAYVYKSDAKSRKYVAHYTMGDYKKHPELTDEQYSDYFKFTFVRNPYDRFLSMYLYLNRLEKKNRSLDKFIKEFPKRFDDMYYFVRPQSDFIEGADFIGSFENIKEDFKLVCDKLKLQGELPFRNKSEGSKPKLTSSQKRVVENLYQKDFEMFYKENK